LNRIIISSSKLTEEFIEIKIEILKRGKESEEVQRHSVNNEAIQNQNINFTEKKNEIEENGKEIKDKRVKILKEYNENKRERSEN